MSLWGIYFTGKPVSANCSGTYKSPRRTEKINLLLIVSLETPRKMEILLSEGRLHFSLMREKKLKCSFPKVSFIFIFQNVLLVTRFISVQDLPIVPKFMTPEAEKSTSIFLWEYVSMNTFS